MYEKATMSLFSLIILTGMLFTWETFLVSNFSRSFNVWFKDVYSKLKIWLSNFNTLSLTAFKLRLFLYFEMASSTESRRFGLKPLDFSLGSFH